VSQHRYTVSDELRKSTRFRKERGTDTALLWLDDKEPELVDVHDESLGGLGLYLDDIEGICTATEITIIYAGEALRAEIKHIERQTDGTFVVGFDCAHVAR
jgi:hypothetical protein